MHKLREVNVPRFFCLLLLLAVWPNGGGVSAQTRIALLPDQVGPRKTTADEKDFPAQPWLDMDFGPCLTTTLHISPDNFAKKGIVTRADVGAGGFAEGHDYLVFDTDTLRCAAGWRGKGGIDYRGLAFSGERDSQPAVVGQLLFENPDAPGWGVDDSAAFKDTRLVGRDGPPGALLHTGVQSALRPSHGFRVRVRTRPRSTPPEARNRAGEPPGPRPTPHRDDLGERTPRRGSHGPDRSRAGVG